MAETKNANSALFFRLLSWFAENKRTLPWRNESDPYRILVSEVMLQQTRVETVKAYYARFLDRFDSAAALAKASEAEVLKAWEGLGYYRRARNLKRACEVVREVYHGEWPEEVKELKRLPGLGDYTAAAMSAIAFGRFAAAIDGNVIRVISRVFAIESEAKSAAMKQKISHLVLEGQKATNDPAGVTESLMELGALVCLPRNPACTDCPLQPFCLAYQRGEVTRFPKLAKKKKTPCHDICAGVIMRAGKVLIVKRPQRGMLGGLWEFPGGKTQNPLQKPAQIQAFLEEKTKLRLRYMEKLATLDHAYTHFKIKITYHRFQALKGKVTIEEHFRWVRPGALGDYPFGKTAKIIAQSLATQRKHSTSLEK